MGEQALACLCISYLALLAKYVALGKLSIKLSIILILSGLSLRSFLFYLSLGRSNRIKYSFYRFINSFGKLSSFIILIE